MEAPLIVIPPIINALITGLFAGVVLRQYLTRHRVYQLYWSIALCMAFIATLAYLFMIVLRPTSATGILLFRLYYVLGGVLMPAWLGMGSIALINKPWLVRLSQTLLFFLSLVGIAFTLDAHIDMQKLSQIAGTPGTGTLQTGPWLIPTIVLNTLGVVAIGGVAIYSGWQMLMQQKHLGGLRTRNVLWANVLILGGALLDAAAGTLARTLGLESAFWLIMAVGWIVLFAGVVLASQRPRTGSVPTKAPNHAHHANV
ncbi:MAG: hypothetical protein J2P37_08320 [Ktedonobacteraceae bacterium]|nr:hypothetical protein [Ktedonobacteraceae bacterium]MBO0794078.1 hypothetical protein [Ktedonobacteraceae bacterium]